DAGEDKNKSKFVQANEEEKKDAEVRELGQEVTNSNDQQDAGLDLEDQDPEVEDAVNTRSSSSRTDKMILKLKFNPESLPSSKKHKHKRKHKEQDEGSHHSHKITGKRGECDSSDETAEKDTDQYNTSDKHTHARKKSKRHNSDIVPVNDEVSRSIQPHGDTSRLSTIERAREEPLSEKQPTVTNNNLTNEVSEKSPYTDTKKNNEISKLGDNGGQMTPHENGNNSIFDDKIQNVDNNFSKKNFDDSDEREPSHDQKEISNSEVLTPTYQLRGNRSYPSVVEEEKPKYSETRPKKYSKVPKPDVQPIKDEAIVVISPPKILEISQPEVVITSRREVDNGNNNHTNTTEETASSFQSTGKKGPARRLGRPPKSQSVQQKTAKRTWTWQKKKKDLRTILSKLLDSFNKKDAYGFFSEPVDTSVVTDYLTIIQNPMDFGTMRKKIDCNEYTSIDEFKEDFSLVCNNCKTYNAPDTIYYKSADKLWQFGEKAIERERDSILLEEEKLKATEAIENGSQGGRVGGKKIANGNNIYGSISSRASSTRQPRRSKKIDPRKLFYPDGSIIPFGDPSSMIPRSPSFGETPLLTVISSKAQRPARFEDYGPYATLGIDPPFFTSNDKNFLYNIYGDEKGYSYAKSIKSFVKDMGDEMNQQVDRFLDKLTRGAHSIDQRVAQMMSTANHSISYDNSIVMQTELGPVNIRQELDRIRKLSELKKQQSDLEMWKKAKIDIDFLTGDQEMHSIMQNMGDSQHNVQELIDLNAKDLAELINIRQSSQSKSDKTEKQITEELNNRFIQLVQHAPDSEKISHTASALRPQLTDSTSLHQSTASFPLGNLKTPSTPLQPIIIPQMNSASHNFSTVEHTDPISALAPSSMLHENNLSGGSFRARTKPCNYNPAGKCANCQTTDTPGWRAGETPDQKLCNACGLYYSKNKSHRPSNLWNTR
ncbi:16171_t:CDS:10, partial [Acaulospora morrowiae]